MSKCTIDLTLDKVITSISYQERIVAVQHGKPQLGVQSEMVSFLY